MSDVIKKVEDDLLAPMSLGHSQLESVLGGVLGVGIDSADIFLQSVQTESWYLENSIVKQGDYAVDSGFGFRVISGETMGFAYANDISLPALQKAGASARSIAKGSGRGVIHVANQSPVMPLYPVNNPLKSYADQEKVDLLNQIDSYTRSLDPRVKQVMVSLSAEYEEVLIINSEGTLAADIRPMVGFSISVIVEENNKSRRGRAGAGGRCDYITLLADEAAYKLAKKAVDQALVNLEAIDAPAGVMPVVLGPGWPAVLLHEAIGHGLEGDFNRKRCSAFTDRLGEKVAQAHCTIVDDGTVMGHRGSLTIDDEGTPTEKTVLIEDGILKNYMQDTHNARLMNTRSTGNGRRESYACLPLPRMTTTYMLPGKLDPQEIIESVEYGLYAVDFAGGQVDITSGKFVFSMSEAYLIEHGKVTAPVTGATLIGDGPDVLSKISMLGNDLQLDQGIGTCGKAGQSVPVGVGQPTLKVDSLTVGGVAVRKE